MAKKKPVSNDCFGLPRWEGVECRNVGPSYPVQTRHEYLQWIKACRKLFKKDPERFYEMGCKREAHMPIPGGRVKSRFPGIETPPISLATAERLAIGPGLGAPWPDHSQSLEVWELTQQRKAQSQLVTFEEAVAIERAIADYMMNSPEVAGGYGFRVPFMPEPLISSGMPRRAAYTLVERAADRVFLPPPKSELAPEESEREHSKFLWMATVSPRLDYKNLGNVNLYDLPAVLARISRRTKRKGRRLKPLAKKNPIHVHVNFDHYAYLQPMESAPVEGQPGLFVYRKADGVFYPKPITAKQLNNFGRAARMGRLLRQTVHHSPQGEAAMSNPFDYDYDDLFAPVGARNNRGRKKKSTRKKKRSTRRKSTARRNMESEFTDERRLSHAQLAAGFGGKAAKNRALNNPEEWHDPRYAQRSRQTRAYGRRKGFGFPAASKRRAGQGKGGYWSRPGGQGRPSANFRGASGQFSAQQRRLKGMQPVNRRNPNPEAAEAMRLHHDEGMTLKKAWRVVKSNPLGSSARRTGSAKIYRKRKAASKKKARTNRGLSKAQLRAGFGGKAAMRKARKKTSTKRKSRKNSGSPWGYDMPAGYPYAVGKGQYGTYRAVPPANRRNPKKRKSKARGNRGLSKAQLRAGFGGKAAMRKARRGKKKR